MASANGGEMNSQAPHVLLVDDEEKFRYAAAKLLKEAGIDVFVAEDYRDALARLESDAQVDLLIVDIVMPGRINGFALARMARMRRLDLKVMYLTGYDVPADEAVGKILRKPIAGETLIEEVRNVLVG